MGLAIVLAIALYLVALHVHTNNIKAKQEQESNYASWLSDNCKCVEHNQLKCLNDFVLNGSFCYRAKEFTYPTRACSKYDCSGTNITLNNQTNTWGPRIN